LRQIAFGVASGRPAEVKLVDLLGQDSSELFSNLEYSGVAVLSAVLGHAIDLRELYWFKESFLVVTLGCVLLDQFGVFDLLSDGALELGLRVAFGLLPKSNHGFVANTVKRIIVG